MVNNNKEVKIKEFQEKVLDIRRVSKKTVGGGSIGFTALVVVGDKDGRIGSGYGKARDVPTAIKKAISKAKGNIVKINVVDGTIAHPVTAKLGAAKVFLKPAPKGTGIIAGGSIRVVVDMAGIENISSKMLGSNNKILNVRCTIKALGELKE
jgi:small subunit ribosomal protein S5